MQKNQNLLYLCLYIMNKKRIVIIGAGFAGITALQKLNKSGLFDVTIISPKSHFEYYPGLYRVLGEYIPFEVFVPFRFLLPKTVTFIKDVVVSVDMDKTTLHTESHGTIVYDELIIAVGMIPSDFGIKGVSTYGHFITTLKTANQTKKNLSDALQKHIISKTDETFNIVIAGAGPTGVELTGELTSFVSLLRKTYAIKKKFCTITLIGRDADVLPQLEISVRKKALKRLHSLGVVVLTENTIMEVTETTVITDKGIIPMSFFFWSAGATQPDLIKNTSEFTLSARKKVIVDKEFLAQGCSHVYVLGDNAETEFSGLAQIAEQDGAFIGNMLVAKALDVSYKPYNPRKPIFVIPIGDYFGILGLYGKTITGIIPWIIRYAVDMRFFFFKLRLKDFISLSIERRLK